MGDFHCACELKTREWLLGKSLFCLAAIFFFNLIKNSVKNTVYIVLLIIFNSYANKYSDAGCAYEWQRQ